MGLLGNWNLILNSRARDIVWRAAGVSHLLLHSDLPLTLELKYAIIDKLLETPQVLTEAERKKFIDFVEARPLDYCTRNFLLDTVFR